VLSKASARTITELWLVIAEDIEKFPAKDYQNYFAAKGYNLE